MVHAFRCYRFFVVMALLLMHAAGWAQPAMYKCVDPVSGAATLGDRPCASGRQTRIGAAAPAGQGQAYGQPQGQGQACDSRASPLEEVMPAANKIQAETVKSVVYQVAHAAASGQQLAISAFIDGSKGLHLCLPPYRTRYQGEVGASEVVIGTDGRVTKQSAAGTRVLRDPGDSLSVLNRCSRLITACFEPQKRERGIDDCVARLPICSAGRAGTEEQPCCPAACQQRYAEQRQAGVGAMTAMDKALFGDKSCVP